MWAHTFAVACGWCDRNCDEEIATSEGKETCHRRIQAAG